MNRRGKGVSCHSSRKTFAFHHRTRHGTDLHTLMMFNHSTQHQMFDYHGIDDAEVSAAYILEI